jgi:membrane protein YdbS with pleckstrin-like domain
MPRRDPYIMPHERRVLTVRQHPLPVLGAPFAILLAVTAAAIWLTASGVAWQLLWLLWLVAVINLAVKAFRWMITYFIITNMRMIVVTGLTVRVVSTLPIVKLVDISYEFTPMGQFFGYGRFIIESAAHDHPLRRINALPRVEAIYHELCSLLFSDPLEQDSI